MGLWKSKNKAPSQSQSPVPTPKSTFNRHPPHSNQRGGGPRDRVTVEKVNQDFCQGKQGHLIVTSDKSCQPSPSPIATQVPAVGDLDDGLNQDPVNGPPVKSRESSWRSPSRDKTSSIYAWLEQSEKAKTENGTPQPGPQTPQTLKMSDDNLDTASIVANVPNVPTTEALPPLTLTPGLAIPSCPIRIRRRLKTHTKYVKGHPSTSSKSTPPPPSKTDLDPDPLLLAQAVAVVAAVVKKKTSKKPISDQNRRPVATTLVSTAVTRRRRLQQPADQNLSQKPQQQQQQQPRVGHGGLPSSGWERRRFLDTDKEVKDKILLALNNSKEYYKLVRRSSPSRPQNFDNNLENSKEDKDNREKSRKNLQKEKDVFVRLYQPGGSRRTDNNNSKIIDNNGQTIIENKRKVSSHRKSLVQQQDEEVIEEATGRDRRSPSAAASRQHRRQKCQVLHQDDEPDENENGKKSDLKIKSVAQLLLRGGGGTTEEETIKEDKKSKTPTKKIRETSKYHREVNKKSKKINDPSPTSSIRSGGMRVHPSSSRKRDKRSKKVPLPLPGTDGSNLVKRRRRRPTHDDEPDDEDDTGNLKKIGNLPSLVDARYLPGKKIDQEIKESHF